LSRILGKLELRTTDGKLVQVPNEGSSLGARRVICWASGKFAVAVETNEDEDERCDESDLVEL
jgi:hypothetical protein